VRYLVLLLFCIACGGTKIPAVLPIQTKDKDLSCREIILEIREATQYKKAAERHTSPGLRTFLAPLGYMYTLTSANEAIEASNERITYLNDISALIGCSNKSVVKQIDRPALMRGHTFSGGFPTPQPLYRPY